MLRENIQALFCCEEIPTVMARVNAQALIIFAALFPPALIQDRRLFETQRLLCSKREFILESMKLWSHVGVQYSIVKLMVWGIPLCNKIIDFLNWNMRKYGILDPTSYHNCTGHPVFHHPRPLRIDTGGLGVIRGTCM